MSCSVSTQDNQRMVAWVPTLHPFDRMGCYPIPAHAHTSPGPAPSTHMSNWSRSHKKRFGSKTKGNQCVNSQRIHKQNPQGIENLCGLLLLFHWRKPAMLHRLHRANTHLADNVWSSACTIRLAWAHGIAPTTKRIGLLKGLNTSGFVQPLQNWGTQQDQRSHGTAIAESIISESSIGTLSCLAHMLSFGHWFSHRWCEAFQY